jgi:hypothetical protein
MKNQRVSIMVFFGVTLPAALLAAEVGEGALRAALPPTGMLATANKQQRNPAGEGEQQGHQLFVLEKGDVPDFDPMSPILIQPRCFFFRARWESKELPGFFPLGKGVVLFCPRLVIRLGIH